MGFMERVAALDAALRAAGVPITGISNTNGTAAGLVIGFSPEATSEQVVQANAIKEAFDFRPRRSLAGAQIAAGIASLTTAQELAFRRRVFAMLCRHHRAEVAAILADLGVPLAIDEVDPTAAA